MIDAFTGFISFVLATFVDRPVTVHIGDWTIVVRPEDNWHDEGGWRDTLPSVEHVKEDGVLRSVIRHVPSTVNLAFVTEEVAIIGRSLGYTNLIPVPPVADPEVTIAVGLEDPVLIGDERGQGQVFVHNGDYNPVVIYDVSDLPEYSFGTVHLVSKEVAEKAVSELGRYDVVANTF